MRKEKIQAVAILALTTGALGTAGTACTVQRDISIDFDTQGVHELVSVVKLFAFDLTKDQSATCQAIDPVGGAPGDAPTRSGKTATASATGSLGGLIGKLDNLERHPFTLAVEAWQKLAVAGQPPQTILRAYSCVDLDLSNPNAVEGVLTLDTTAPIGSAMTIPMEGAQAFGPDAPLLLTEGEPAIDPFKVQLLDDQANSIAGRPVWFGVLDSSGGLVNSSGGTSSSAVSLTNVDGTATATAIAAAAGSMVNGGLLRFGAYTPGFQNSPTVFNAKVLSAFRTEVRWVQLPKSTLDLEDTDEPWHPIALADLDGDGVLDVVLPAGRQSHRLAILYGNADGSYQTYVSPSLPGEAYGVGVATLNKHRDAKPSIIVTSGPPLGGTTQTFPPAIEFWANPDTNPTSHGGDWTATATDTGPCDCGRTPPNACTCPKTAFVMAAADLDGTGKDALAFVRCSDPNSDCVTSFAVASTADIMLFEPGNDGRYKTRYLIDEQIDDGGFHELRFADLNKDGQIDLVTVTADKVVGFCGGPGLHYGFDPAARWSENLTFGQPWGVAIGNLDGDDLPDVVAGGGLRQVGGASGVVVEFGCAGCTHGDNGATTPCGVSHTPKSLLVGPANLHQLLVVGVGDLNQDGFDDIIAVDRMRHRLYTYLGARTGALARGPSFELPTGILGALAVSVEKEAHSNVVVAAMSDPTRNAVLVLRFLE
jgi:hypothetical protein